MAKEIRLVSPSNLLYSYLNLETPIEMFKHTDVQPVVDTCL